MRSKTSFFNRTIFMKNILRFWPMWILYLAVLFFSLPVSLYLRTNPQRLHAANLAEAQLREVVTCVNWGTTANFVYIFVMAIVLVLLIFSYLYSARSCNMMHALPVSRKELFVTGYLNALLFLVVPQVLMFLISLIVCILNRVTCVEYLLYWLIFSVIASFLFVSGAVFAAMLSGNVIAALIYYVAGNLIYVAARALIGGVISAVCYGMGDFFFSMTPGNGVGGSVLSPIVYLVGHVGVALQNGADGIALASSITGMKIMLLYLIPAALLLIFAAVLYQKRQLECAGDIVAYRWMNPVFRWVVAFFAGVGLGLFISGVFLESSRYFTLCLVIFSAVLTLLFFFLGEMILKKRFRIFAKRIWIEGLVCAAVMLFLTGALEGDLFRAERRIPKTDQVQSVLLEAPGFDVVLTDADKIQALEAAHQSIIDHKAEYEDLYYAEANGYEDAAAYADNVMASYQITYYLKNGGSIERRYSVPVGGAYLEDPDSSVSLLGVLLGDPEAFLEYKICKNYEDVQYLGASVDFPILDLGNDGYYSDSVSLNGEQATMLYQAVLQDVREGNYPYYEESNSYLSTEKDAAEEGEQYYNSISFSGQVSGEAVSIYDDLPDRAATANSVNSALTEEQSVGDETMYTDVYPTFSIYKSCTHTIQALTDLGVIGDESDLTTWEQYNEWEENMYAEEGLG